MKRWSQQAERIEPHLAQVQRVTVAVTEVQDDPPAPQPSAGEINVEAKALEVATSRGDRVTGREQLLKVSNEGSLGVRFMQAGSEDVIGLPNAATLIDRSSLRIVGAQGEVIAFQDGTGAKLVRGGNRLLEIGYDTLEREFPASVALPGGIIATESGALGIGVGWPASALHVSALKDQFRVDHPEGGSLLIEVDAAGIAHVAPAAGHTRIYGTTTVDGIAADSADIRHLHTATQVLDKTLALSGWVGMAAVSAYVMDDVVGGAWTYSPDGGQDRWVRTMPLIVAERIDEPAVQLFAADQTVEFAWVDRGVNPETLVKAYLDVATYDSRDQSVYPARQVYTLIEYVFVAPANMNGGELLVPSRAIASGGAVGALSMLAGKPAFTIGADTGMGNYAVNFDGFLSTKGLLTVKTGSTGAVDGADLEYLRAYAQTGQTGLELTASRGVGTGPALKLYGASVPPAAPPVLLAFSQAAGTLAITATTLQASNVQLYGAEVIGDLTFTGTGRRIIGDFGNATAASRPMVQSNTGTYTAVGVLPPAGQTSTYVQLFNGTDPDNSSLLSVAATSTDMRIASTKLGSGTNLPLLFRMDATTRATLNASGDWAFTPASKVDLSGALNVTGSADVMTLQVRGSSAQSTTSIFGVQANNGTSYFAVGPTGRIGVGSNVAPSASAQLYVYAVVGDYGNALLASTAWDTAGGGYGVQGIVSRTGTQSAVIGIGTLGVAYYGATAGTTSYLVGLYGRVQITGSTAAGTISNAWGLWIDAAWRHASATTAVTQSVGQKISNQGGSWITNSYAIFIDAQSGATASYGIWQNGTGPNRLADRLELYGSVAASKQFVVRGASAQSGNLVEWADSAGTAYGAITSAGYLGLGTASPSSAFELHATTIARIYRYANPGNLQLYRGNGTQASPTQVLTGEAVGQLTFVGYGTGGWPATASAQVRAVALENFTSTAAGMSVEIRTAPIGSVTPATRVTFDTAGLTMADAHDIVVGSATGTKIGTATTQKLAFHGAAPVAQRSGAAQAAVGTTAATQTTPWGYTTQAQADAIVTLLNEIRAALVEKGIIAGA